jgi:hypothetical protein
MLDRLKHSSAIFAAAFLVLSPFAATQETKPQTPLAQTAAPANNVPTATKHTLDGRPILEEGTPVRMRITRTVSSADAKTGDRVDFEVLDAINVGDAEAIPQGGIAWGTVTDAHSKKSMGRGGKLDINIDTVKLSNGDKAALRAVKETKGGGHQGAVTGAMVATSIVFFPAAPLFLFIKGKDITIPKGTEITAYVNSDTPFYLSPTTTPRLTAIAVSATAELEVTSTPDGADIEIDGVFNGSTPSTVILPPGDHSIVVKKDSYQAWERKMHVSLGHINLKAELLPIAKK